MNDNGLTLGRAARTAVVAMAAFAALLASAGSAAAYQAANGWVASDYATGFPFHAGGAAEGAAGPVGLVFDGGGNLLVADNPAAALYKVAPGGGSAAATKLRDGYGQAAGLAFDTSGRLYLARGAQHDVVELNPASGEVIRTVVSGLPCPVGLATDPVSGDLFVSNVFCKGGGIDRITGFAGAGAVARPYAGTQDADGLTFAPDGTLFAAAGNKIVRIAGTNTSTPGAVSDVVALSEVDGIAFAPQTERDDSYLVVNRNSGEIDRVDFGGGVTPVLTGGSRGDLVTVGPDRCIYADLQDRVIKLGPATGACFFSPPVQPGIGGDQSVLGTRVAARVIDTAVKARMRKHVRRGTRFTLKLIVSNRSATAAHTVVLTDKLAPGLKFVKARSVKGVKCKRKRSVVCRKSTLAARKSYVVKILVRALRRSSYLNSATVKSNDLDPRPGNNRAKTRTRVKRTR